MRRFFIIFFVSFFLVFSVSAIDSSVVSGCFFDSDCVAPLTCQDFVCVDSVTVSDMPSFGSNVGLDVLLGDRVVVGDFVVSSVRLDSRYSFINVSGVSKFDRVVESDLRADFGKNVSVSSTNFVDDLCDKKDFKDKCGSKRSGIHYSEVVINGRSVKVFSGVNTN